MLDLSEPPHGLKEFNIENLFNMNKHFGDEFRKADVPYIDYYNGKHLFNNNS